MSKHSKAADDIVDAILTARDAGELPLDDFTVKRDYIFDQTLEETGRFQVLVTLGDYETVGHARRSSEHAYEVNVLFRGRIKKQSNRVQQLDAYYQMVDAVAELFEPTDDHRRFDNGEVYWAGTEVRQVDYVALAQEHQFEQLMILTVQDGGG